MAPRAYNNEQRAQQQLALKARIAQAAAGLHAQRGVLATSYAEIAREAGVSLPTVYKHYPTLDALVGACSGHVASQAPQFDAQSVLQAPDLASAVQALVKGTDRLNAYFAPWMAWREQHRVPVLAQAAGQRREQMTQLCAGVLRAHGVGAGLRAKSAAWEALLNFEFWHRLVHGHGLTRAAVRQLLAQLLLAAAEGRPAAASSHPRPRRSSR
ncbi:MAG TPA: helix-turn-helix domain-containing protein, partial [Ramlibacter sp.]|nr:helix-turn-helix domain-containing protein [Ramlibacter sp.]